MDPAVELRHLRSFVAVAEELHFGRAALRLHMAQPPLSQQIRRLEAAVGCTLLERTSRSVRLTPAGAAFLERARRTLRNVASDVEEARSIGRGATGRLALGVVGSSLLTSLPRALAAHLAAHPGVELQLREGHTSQVVAGLLDGELDAGIVRDADPVPGFAATTLLAEPFVAVLPADHRHARAGTLSVAALEGEPFVSPVRAGGVRAYEKPLSLCEEHGFRPRIAHEASHWLTVVQLVGAGFGVALAPACVATVATPTTSCVPLAEDHVRSEVALLAADDEARPMVRALAGAAVAAAAG